MAVPLSGYLHAKNEGKHKYPDEYYPGTDPTRQLATPSYPTDRERWLNQITKPATKKFPLKKFQTATFVHAKKITPVNPLFHQ